MLKALGYAVAASRAIFGVAYIAAPTPVSEGWIGKAARPPQVDVISRSVGARDLVLGAGAAVALATGNQPRAWFAAQAVSDSVDFIATALAGNRLPRSGYRLGMAMAGGSAVAAAAVALGLRDPDGWQRRGDAPAPAPAPSAAGPGS